MSSIFSAADSADGALIGEAARQSGVSSANIRFYEKQGLLGSAARGSNRYRRYSAQAIHRLRFIRLCRAMAMSLDEVRSLLGLDLLDKADCAKARDAIDTHLAHVRARQAELEALAGELQALRRCCDGQGATCQLIETLHAQADALALQPVAPASGPRHL